MALSNLDELTKEIIAWSHRNDLGTRIPDFITLAENAMYSNEEETLNIRSLETITTDVTASDLIDLPVDFESARSIRLLTGDSGGTLQYQAPEQMRKEVSTGRPLFFTIIGDQIQLDRVPDSGYTIEIQYFRKAAPLTTLTPTNEVLTNHPSVYLFGALTALFAYTQDAEQQIKYNTMFISAIKGANAADKKGRYGPAPSLSLVNGMVV